MLIYSLFKNTIGWIARTMVIYFLISEALAYYSQERYSGVWSTQLTTFIARNLIYMHFDANLAHSKRDTIKARPWAPGPPSNRCRREP
jgi:hypothetical protein